MAWKYIDFQKLAYKVGSDAPVEIAPYLCSRMGNALTAEMLTHINSYESGSARDDNARYSILNDNTIGFDCMSVLVDLPNNTEMFIYNPEFRNDVGFSVSINRNNGLLTIKRNWFGTVTTTRQFAFGLGSSEIHINLSFMYNDETNAYLLVPFCCGGWDSSGHHYAFVYYYASNNGQDTTIGQLLWLNNHFVPPTPSTDPYSGGGYSTGTGTGTGTFDDTSESVPLPTTYALSATAAGIMSQYVLTEANLAAFGSWLWNGGTIVDDLKHFFQSPMEAIFSVGILPFTPSDTTPYNVYVGALAATGVQGGLVGDTVEKISCGSITFDGYYGGALDYNPYTKIELFLPYCGTLTLNADEVMGHTISVDYYCDTITGDCVAFVSDEERVLHQVRGNCFIQIPLAARDFTALYSSAIAAIGTIAAGLATAASGGLSAPVAVGMGSSMAANAMNAKTHIARAGGVSGMAGFMSIQTPYVIMTIPNQCLPEFQNDFQGYPLFVTKRLGDFSGFTKVYEIHLDGLDCTDAESKEIYELLKGGVIL